MDEFQDFRTALNGWSQDIEDEKQIESLYEKKKDLDCYDFISFYLKAHNCYKKLGNLEEAKVYIDKSIESIPLKKEYIFSSVENSRLIFEPFGNNKYVPVAVISNDQKSSIYTLAGEIYSILELDNEALEYYKRAMCYKTFLKTDLDEKDYVYLYTFRSFNVYSLSDLINSEITVSPSKNMNDPFDSIINLWGTKELLEITCKEPKHIKNLSRSFDYFRIRSFCNGNTTRALKNILMWSHYADNHRGYCIKYKLSKHFIKQDENDRFEHMFLKPIIYRNDKDKVDISEMTTINTDLAFATKHESWGYENEVRLIVYNPNKEDAFYGIPLDKDSCIEAIYFGCRCEQKTINTIKNLFSKTDTPPKFYQMKSDSKDIFHLKWDKSV